MAQLYRIDEGRSQTQLTAIQRIDEKTLVKKPSLIVQEKTPAFSEGEWISGIP